MEPAYYAIALIPLIVALVAKFVFGLRLSWVEVAIQFIAGAAVVGLLSLLLNLGSNSDTEVLNGAVTRKYENTFRCPTNTSNPCRNGYSCNCVTVCTPTYDSKGNVSGQSCTTTCDTCYRYAWERDWFVDSNLGKFEISRIDAQGANMPPRWERVNVGDPVSKTGRFTNWMKRASNSIYAGSQYSTEGFEDILPQYPSRVYDYYHVDRVLAPNVGIRRIKEWNSELHKRLSVLGPKKELNAIIVFVDAPENYSAALQSHWKGFKQNDAVIVVGVRNGMVAWTDVKSWSKQAIFDVKMNNMLREYKGEKVNDIDPNDLLDKFSVIANDTFVRRPMEEFEYLKNEIKPPRWLLLTLTMLSLILGVGLSYLFHQTEIGEDNQNARYRRIRETFSQNPFNRSY